MAALHRPYLKVTGSRRPHIDRKTHYCAAMNSTLSTPPSPAQGHSSQRTRVIVAAVVGALLAGTAAMWVHFGTAVFYEMIVAGIATCL